MLVLYAHVRSGEWASNPAVSLGRDAGSRPSRLRPIQLVEPTVTQESDWSLRGGSPIPRGGGVHCSRQAPRQRDAPKASLPDDPLLGVRCSNNLNESIENIYRGTKQVY